MSAYLESINMSVEPYMEPEVTIVIRASGAYHSVIARIQNEQLFGYDLFQALADVERPQYEENTQTAVKDSLSRQIPTGRLTRKLEL